MLDFSKIKTKGEKRCLDSTKVSIEQVPVCSSILVSGLSDNTTPDAIKLHFESGRNSGGLVKGVQFVPGSGRAVFEDPRGSYLISLVYVYFVLFPSLICLVRNCADIAIGST